MFPLHVALLAETKQISASELNRVAAALSKQVVRDFGPLWGIHATVNSFTRLEDVPIGYWPIIVEDDIHTPGAAGVHEDKKHQPFALVQYSRSWSLTASHECLEMLADPFGNRLIAGQSPKKGQGRVQFLVEVCDPPEDARFSYTVNSEMVSDFITPHFYDPVKSVGVRYSDTGAVTAPRQVLPGGYMSWYEPVTKHWWQEIYFGGQRKFRDLGVLGDLTGNLRAQIDAMTPHPQLGAGGPARDSRFMLAAAVQETTDESTDAQAEEWRAQIKAIKGKGK